MGDEGQSIRKKARVQKRITASRDEWLLFKVLFVILLLLNVLNWLAPVLSASRSLLLQEVGAGIYFLLDPICHQLPDRCLRIEHIPMALCVRCTFIYLGAFLGLIVLFWQKHLRLKTALAVGVGIFVGGEILLEKFGMYSNWPILRGVSGFLSGFVVVLYFGRFTARKSNEKNNMR